METALRADIRSMSLFWSVKHPKVDAFAVYLYPGAPSVAADAWMFKDAEESTLAIHARIAEVLFVLAVSYVAKIADAIVARIPVDVINLAARPFAINVQPREPVRVVPSVVYRNEVGAAWSQCSLERNADTASAASVDKPFKVASVRCVPQNVAKSLRGKIGISHDALQMLIGQRPVGVRAPSGLAILA